MVNCPVCDTEIDVEDEELDEGDTLSCAECGADLRVVNLAPLELVLLEEAADEDALSDLDEEDEEEEDWK